MMRHPVRDFGHSEELVQKWEYWANGRARSRTICIRLWADADLSIAHRAVGSDGRMSELHAFTCNAEHLPKLIQGLTRALAAARKHGLIKQEAAPQ
jgi:hypothetical protein